MAQKVYEEAKQKGQLIHRIESKIKEFDLKKFGEKNAKSKLELNR